MRIPQIAGLAWFLEMSAAILAVRRWVFSSELSRIQATTLIGSSRMAR